MKSDLLKNHPLPWSLSECGEEGAAGNTVLTKDANGDVVEKRVFFVCDADDDCVVYLDFCSDSEKEAMQFLLDSANATASKPA